MNSAQELNPPFEVHEPPHWRGPLLFNSPHSGRIYPRAFLDASRLDLVTLRRSEDTFVDELVSGVVERGYPLMRAHFPRCYVDVNREPYELDPRMFEGRLPSFANTRSMRVAGGLGTVARVVGDAQEIYDQRISVDDALQRIESLYKPYHRTLRRLFARLHRDFGAAILIDCHSMPSTTNARDDRPRADVVIGDRYGTSCVGLLSAIVEDTLRDCGYAVSRNKPYAGASSPSITATPPPDCIPSSSRSTAPSTWTRSATSGRPGSPGSRPTWNASPPTSRRSRLRSCGRGGRRRNSLIHCAWQHPVPCKAVHEPSGRRSWLAPEKGTETRRGARALAVDS